jgi:hypothetical protein
MSSCYPQESGIHPSNLPLYIYLVLKIALIRKHSNVGIKLQTKLDNNQVHTF